MRKYLPFGNLLFLFLFIPIALMPILVPIVGEWNEKPVMCASEEETYKTIDEKEEVLIFTGLEFAKVRSESGYKVKPATLPFRFYVNLETGTYTVIEYHPEYASYCVISYGVNLQTFGGDIL